MEEGVEFKLLNNPVQILGDENGNVRAIECVEMELGEPDASGRRKPIVKEGSNFELPVDMVIMSIEYPDWNALDPGYYGKSGSQQKRRVIGTRCQMRLQTVTALLQAESAVTGAATVIKAMGAGKKAAASIDKYFNK